MKMPGLAIAIMDKRREGKKERERGDDDREDVRRELARDLMAAMKDEDEDAFLEAMDAYHDLRGEMDDDDDDDDEDMRPGY